MIGLMFLGAAILWLVLSIYLTINVPRWFGLKNRGRWLLRLVLVPLLLAGPFVDEIVGMRQFEELCEEQTGIRVSVSAASVKGAIRTYSPAVTVQGSLIDITLTTATYVDVATNEVFLTYSQFSTGGGRIAGPAFRGGRHSCSAEDVTNRNFPQFSALNPYELLKNGRGK